METLVPHATPRFCCAILTEPVSPAFAFIHDRQPVVLAPECRWQWLDPELSDRETIRKAVRRLDPDRLTAYRLSIKVNRPENDGPSLIDEIEGEGVFSCHQWRSSDADRARG